MKITIKLHNEAYIEAIRFQTGMQTHAEALNYLLTVLRMDGFSLIDGEKYVPVSNTTKEIKPSPRKEIVTEKKCQRSNESSEIDPMIQRLISAGICQEF